MAPGSAASDRLVAGSVLALTRCDTRAAGLLTQPAEVHRRVRESLSTLDSRTCGPAMRPCGAALVYAGQEGAVLPPVLLKVADHYDRQMSELPGRGHNEVFHRPAADQRRPERAN